MSCSAGIIGNSLFILDPLVSEYVLLGLPYAIRQAGFITGIVLLVILCGVTDWTIRLIVTNAKLSGRNSYIEIMHHCFGSSGRAAVSFFQFAFAFGGEILRLLISFEAFSHVNIQACAPLELSSVSH